MFENYLKKTFNKSRKEYELICQNTNQDIFEKRIVDLRTLKYARVLINTIEKKSTYKDFKIFVTPKGSSNSKNKLILVEYQIIGIVDEIIILELIKELIEKPPLSKFGIEPTFKFLETKQFNGERHWGYTKTNTYSYFRNPDFNSNKIRVVSEICVDLNENDYL